jgi:uncharacterized protein
LKLSREKILQLSHVVLRHLNEEEAVEFFADPQEIRQDVVKLISDEVKVEDVIDTAVRRRITSQKKNIPEGSAEWDVLYRKYYEDELKSHRKAMP